MAHGYWRGSRRGRRIPEQGLKRTLGLALWIAAAASGAAIFAIAAFPPLQHIQSTRAIINLESACALALLGACWLRKPEGACTEHAERCRLAWVAGVLAMVIAACFWSSLSIGFLSDDFLSVKFAHILTAGRLLEAFRRASGGAFFRPLEYVSLSAMAPFAGFDAVRWHAANLVLHFVNCVLVYGVAARLYAGRWTPAVASLLFAVHGSRPEAVTWVTGRLELIAAFFFLAALLLYLRYCETSGASLLAASVFSMLCAILTKESAYVFPLVLLLIGVFRKDGAYRRVAAHLPFWLAAAAVFAYRWSLLGGIGGYQDARIGLAGALKALLLRAWAVLYFPINWSAPPGIVLALAIGLYVAALVWASRSAGWFPFAFTMVTSLPAAALLMIGSDLQKARLLYVPSLGYCLMAALSVEALQKAWMRWAAVAAIAGFHICGIGAQRGDLAGRVGDCRRNLRGRGGGRGGKGIAEEHPRRVFFCEWVSGVRGDAVNAKIRPRCRWPEALAARRREARRAMWARGRAGGARRGRGGRRVETGERRRVRT